MNEPPPLRQFLVDAERIWRHYQQQGPGRGDPADAETLRRKAAAVRAAGPLEPAVEQALSRVVKTLAQCCERTQGIHFVTGEAGLIPNKPLIAQLEASLQRLRAFAE